MSFEERVIPRPGYVLVKAVPIAKTRSGLVLAGSKNRPGQKGEDAGGWVLTLLARGEGVSWPSVGARVLINNHLGPSGISHGDGYEATDGSELFLYPADQVLAVVDPELAALNEAVD